MRSVLFSQDVERARAFERIFRAEGYDTEIVIVEGAPRVVACGYAIAFLDLAMGSNVAAALATQIAGSETHGLPPLVAILGEPAPDEIALLVTAGANMYFADDLATLALRIRFLHGAVTRRSQFTRARDELQASEDRYRTVISAMEEGLIVRSADGTVTTINPSAARLLGLDAEEARTRQWSVANYIHPDGSPVATCDLPSYRALLTGEPVLGCEIGVCRRDGTIAWCSTNAHPIRDTRTGEIVAAVATITDTTARRRIELGFRSVLEGAPDPVLVHRDGTVLWANAKWVELLGYDSAHELVGRTLVSFVPPRHKALLEERIRLRVAGIDVPPIEYPLLRRDGSEVHCLIVGAPMLFEGEPARVGFARDLTEQRRIEMQLMAADRLASLGRLAASVGHEINNPLTYVIGNLELAAMRLRRGEITTPGLLELIDEALKGSDRVRRIAADLKVFVKSGSETGGTTDLRAVVDSCVRMTSGEVRHRARLIQDIDEVPPVEGNQARVAQVVSNLLLNAAEAIPEGQADSHVITISARAMPDGHVVVRVADTGVGIAPEHLPHVFEPFFTTKDDRGGTGLGLSVCNMLVASQGGHIEVESVVGKGTVVTVRLRAAQCPGYEASRGEQKAPVPVPDVTRRRVLVVDDELRIAELLREHLDVHDVTLAGSGREALARIASSAPFDAIVCDLMMPDLGGIDVHERVRVDRPGLESKIVFMTGGAFTPRAAQFLHDVRNPRLEKPFEISALLAAIEAVAG